MEQVTGNGSTEVAPTTELPKEVAEPRRKSAKARRPEPGVRYLMIDSGDAKEWARIKLPVDDGDPRWDPRLKLPVPRDFVVDLATNGVDADIEVTEEKDGTFSINNGRTRVRAIPEANKIRKKKGEPPLRVGLKVVQRDEFEAMRAGVRLNHGVLTSDPVTMAAEMLRYYEASYTEEEIAADFHVSKAMVPAYLNLNGLPPEVKQLVRCGKLSVSAAAAVSKLDAAEINRRAQQMTAAPTKRAASAAARGQAGSVRLSAKATVKLIEELEASAKEATGAKVKLALDAAVLALETSLDSRKAEKLQKRLWDAAK